MRESQLENFPNAMFAGNDQNSTRFLAWKAVEGINGIISI